MNPPDLDLFTGKNKLLQMEIFADMFHKSAHGKFLSRQDGSFVHANQTLSIKLNIPEIAFDDLTINDLLFPEGVDYKLPFTKEQHQGWMDNWFQWPYPLTLEQRGSTPFHIWGYGSPTYSKCSPPQERVEHQCIIILKPIYVREVGKMIVIDGTKECKQILAFGSVIFLEDFKSLKSS